MNEFPMFKPNGHSNNYCQKTLLTKQTVQQTFPFSAKLCENFSPKFEITSIENFAKKATCNQFIEELRKKFTERGSDKATTHNYHLIYGTILSNKNITSIFEVGLGTNDTNIVSNMGSGGEPGASFRAFRDVCKTALVHGADIDRNSLFVEERIETFYVYQTKWETYEKLAEITLPKYDLIIDDGLHSADAHISTLNFALGKVSKEGWIVIEDINSSMQPLFQVIAALIPKDRYECYLIKAKMTLVFAVKRIQ